MFPSNCGCCVVILPEESFVVGCLVFFQIPFSINLALWLVVFFCHKIGQCVLVWTVILFESLPRGEVLLLLEIKLIIFVAGKARILVFI